MRADPELAKRGETHFSVQVVSEKFNGLVSPTTVLAFHRHHRRAEFHEGGGFPLGIFTDTQRTIARHRLVNEALKPEFDNGLHALAIKAIAPDEV